MRKYEHGGDVFAEESRMIDLSVNINPLGMPLSAAEAAQKAVREEISYPDPFCRKLTAALSERYGLPAENIVCGNGASDLILRLCAAVRPARVYVPAPGFSEYARSAALFGAKTLEYGIPGFDCGRSLAELITGSDDTDSRAAADDNDCSEIPAADDKNSNSRLAADDNDGKNSLAFPYDAIVFVCRPNNPDGSMMSLDELRGIASACENNRCLLAVDECFLEFTDATSALALLDRHRNIIVINAFTKTYALAGLRLGFAFSADTVLLDEIYRFGIPWSVSSAAQAAGEACCGEISFLAESRRYIAEERKRIISVVESLGLTVFPSDANFLLIKDDRDFAGANESGKSMLQDTDTPEKPALREALELCGIKVRDCRSFSGLDDSFIRIGVRTKEENDVLIKALEDIYG